MSATITSVVTPGGATGLSTPALDAAAAGARSFGGFVAAVEQEDPQLATRVANATTDQSLLGSKTVYVPPLVYLVTLLSTHFAIGWDQTTCQFISVALLYVSVVISRWAAKHEVARILPAAWTNPPAPSAMRAPPAIKAPSPPKDPTSPLEYPSYPGPPK